MSYVALGLQGCKNNNAVSCSIVQWQWLAHVSVPSNIHHTPSIINQDRIRINNPRCQHQPFINQHNASLKTILTIANHSRPWFIIIVLGYCWLSSFLWFITIQHKPLHAMINHYQREPIIIPIYYQALYVHHPPSSSRPGITHQLPSRR